jgi:hypothetical protein
MTGYIEADWQDYVKKVMPPHPSALQMQETRRAFYAGASALLFTMMRIMDRDDEPTPADLAKMEAIDDELHQFAQDVGAGRA